MNPEDIEADFDWFASHSDATFQEYEDGSEIGNCEVCHKTYYKDISKSNVSRTGQCFRCGFNP